MCIGVPMRVLECGAVWAWCEDGGERQQVDMQLVGPQPAGSWVLVFLGAAREVLDEERALRVRDALSAMQAVLAGAPIDHLFADLIEREPRLPDHLQPDHLRTGSGI